jgi:hypothetical protein
MTIYFVVDNPPPEFGQFQFMSKGYTSKMYANDRLKEIKKNIDDDYVCQYLEVAKILVIK